MFIRKVIHRNKKKEYTYYRLVENVRIGDKVRQRTLLNLGQLPLAKEKHPFLVRRIREYLNGQLPLLEAGHEIESLAFYYFQQIRNREATSGELPPVKVLLNSLEAGDSRSIGAEQVGLTWFSYLEMDKMFHNLGFTRRQIQSQSLFWQIEGKAQRLPLNYHRFGG